MLVPYYLAAMLSLAQPIIPHSTIVAETFVPPNNGGPKGGTTGGSTRCQIG